MEEKYFHEFIDVGRKTYVGGLSLSFAVFVIFTIFAHRLEGIGQHHYFCLINLAVVFLLIVLQAYFVFKMENYQLYARVWSLFLLEFFILGLITTGVKVSWPLSNVLIGLALGILGSFIVFLSTMKFGRGLAVTGFSALILSWIYLTSNLRPLGYYWEAMNAGFPMPGTYCLYPVMHPVMYLLEISTGLSIATLVVAIIYSVTFSFRRIEFENVRLRFNLFLSVSSTIVAIALVYISHLALRSIDIIQEILNQIRLSPPLTAPTVKLALISDEIAVVAAGVMVVGAVFMATGSYYFLLKAKL